MHYPQIDPLALSVGPLQIHWYGLMYMLAFLFAWRFGLREARRKDNNLTSPMVGDLIFYGALGAILGGRLGYALFYSLQHTLSDPLSILRIWEGGMSFHGGLVGVMVACWLYGKKLRLAFFEVTDFVAPLVPVGLGLGRIGNFINAELPGRVTQLPWGLHYPCEAVRQISTECRLLSAESYEPVLRHPSALYQAFTDGILLAVAVILFTRQSRRLGVASGFFLVGYGSLRFVTEFFRSPDAHIGYVLGGFITMGQLLSLPLVLLGLFLLFWLPQNVRRGKRNETVS